MKLPFGLRWWELLPEVVLVGGLSVFLVTETSAALSALKSGTAIRLMVLVGLSWVIARLLLVRFTNWPWLRLVVFGAAAAIVLNVVVLPAYDDTTVVEALPAVVADPAPTTTQAPPTTTQPPPTTTQPAPLPTTASTAVTTVPTSTTVAPPTTTTATTTAPAPPTTEAPAPASTTTLPPAPVVVSSAPLHGIDHRASGTARIYRLADGALVVGLEEIDIQPGPDYDVYVVPGADREGVGDGTRLDDLRGNKGTQYYVVPAGVDVSTGAWTVLVWCETFDVPVAAASPAPG